MKFFEEQVVAGEWEEVERYLAGFTKVDDNRYSMKIFFEIRKQKYLEALDKYVAFVPCYLFSLYLLRLFVFIPLWCILVAVNLDALASSCLIWLLTDYCLRHSSTFFATGLSLAVGFAE